MKRFWSALRRRPIALASLILLAILYFGMVFCEFLAPYGPNDQFANHSDQPPSLQLYSRTLGFRPQVQTLVLINDFTREYAGLEGHYTPVNLFAVGPGERLWGLFAFRHHLFGTDRYANPGGEAEPVFLFGTDNLGR